MITNHNINNISYYISIYKSSTTKSGFSTSIFSSLLSSMLKPNLIILWILFAKLIGSSKLKPDVKRDVSNNNHIRSLTVESPLFVSLFF